MTTDLSTPSTPTTPPPGHARAADRRGPGWFRAFWRWHFYASFLVVPVLLMLSVTGVVYLLRFQVEPLLHADLMKVEQPAGSSAFQPYATQLAAVERAFPGAEVGMLSEPRGEGRSTVVSLTTASGETRDVFVDPWTARVLGSLDPDSTLSGIAVRLHGDLMSGRLGDGLIELAACWAIVMALTGYYLFWRGRRARRRGQGKRLRRTHALVGAVTGVGLLMLVVSGLPWTGVWGERAQSLASGTGTSLWATDPGALSDPTSTLDESLPHAHRSEVPWAQGDTPVPRSEPGSGSGSVASVDTAVAVGAREGLRHPMTVLLPADDAGVFSVMSYAFDAPSDERTVHVDQYGGEPVSSYGFDDYPLLAKAVAQGIGLHEGRSLGPVSFTLAAGFCLAVVFLCLTGPLMWWRRRPRGASSVGAPRGRMELRASPLLAVGLVLLGLFLPLFGASLLLVLVLDQLLLRRVPLLARWFDVRA